MTFPVFNPITAPCPVEELCPLPLFCHPMSYEQDTLTKPSVSFFAPFSTASFLSKAIFCRQLVWELFPQKLLFPSLDTWMLLGYIVGTLSLDNRLLRWVSPMPVCKHPRTAREFMSWVSGPRWPLLCASEVFTLFFPPHTAQVTEKTEASPNLFSSVVLHSDSCAEN